MAVSGSKARICHDLSFAVSGTGVNEGTDKYAEPECKVGHVSRTVVWRILYLHGKFVAGKSPSPRILIAKNDLKSAYRQICVDIEKAPTFASLFRNVVIIDRCLQFGWTSSPSFWGVCAAAMQHAHTRTNIRNALITAEGRQATSHVRVEPPREGEVQAELPPDDVYPPGVGGRMSDMFWAETFVDDAIVVEVESPLEGRRCLRASRSYASDCFRGLGSRQAREPPLFSREKTTSWDTRMDVLGWTLDTKAMTNAVPHEKIARLREMLEQWPVERQAASVQEVQSLLGKLLHCCKVVRPGKCFIQRVINYLGLPPLKSGELGRTDIVGEGRRHRKWVKLGPEFHNNLSFWRLILDMATGSDGVTRFEFPLNCCFLQPPSRLLMSDASGGGMGGYCLESGKWWRIDFTLEERSRLRERVQGRDDLSINVFELLAMVVTAWALTVHEEETPEYPGQSILMKGDNMSAVHWVNQCRGSKEPRSGALMRIMGVLEVRNGWRFRAKHIKGVANTIADGISRWDRNDIALNLHSCRPDVCWQEQLLGGAARALISGVLASSSSEMQLRTRLKELTRQVSGLGKSFAG